jgi:hypothetical protein
LQRGHSRLIRKSASQLTAVSRVQKLHAPHLKVAHATVPFGANRS